MGIEKFERLLPILCCPYSRSPLTLIELSDLQKCIPATEWSRLPEGTTGAMVSSVSSNAYPIVEDSIVNFLEQDTLKLSANDDEKSAPQDEEALVVREGVKKWYDEFGWKPSESQMYGDTATFSQLGQTGHGFYEMDSHLSILDRFLGGEFLLDAASGAISHPEYLSYSWFYKYRVCVDLSIAGLREAARKIGDRGFFCMADICRLPFRDNVFDGIVSGYTIQHIARSEQKQAIAELYRVLAPNKHCCIMTKLRHGIAHTTLLRICRLMMKIFTPRKADFRSTADEIEASSGPDLYGHSNNLAWWRKTLSSLNCSFLLRTLRIFDKKEFETLFGDSLHAAKTLRLFENWMPRLLTRFCRYCLVDLLKKIGSASQ